MKFSWIASLNRLSNKIELLANRGDVLAQNQTVPSAREPYVSSLAISQHLPHLCDEDMAATQSHTQNGSLGQKQWVKRDAISAWQLLSCEPRRPLITAALVLCGLGCFVPLGTLKKRAAEGKKMLFFFFCGAVKQDFFFLQMYFMGCLWKQSKCWIYTMKCLAVGVNACCLWDDAVGCLASSLPVSLLWVGVMRNLHTSTSLLLHLLLNFQTKSLEFSCCRITPPTDMN